MDVGGIFDKLILASWEQSALAKGLPAYIIKDGWFDISCWLCLGSAFIQLSQTKSHIKRPPRLEVFYRRCVSNAILPASGTLVVIYYFYSKERLPQEKGAKEKAGKTGFGAGVAGHMGIR